MNQHLRNNSDYWIKAFINSVSEVKCDHVTVRIVPIINHVLLTVMNKSQQINEYINTNYLQRI